MDNKGLNINRPLLSVRRCSSISSSPKCENRRHESYLTVRPVMESCKTGSTSKSMMNSGSVPFGWEHTPGRPKNERSKQAQSMDNPPSVPKLPPGWFFKPRNISKSEWPKSTKSSKKQSSGSRNDGYGDDNNEAFVDAVGTISRGETSFHNCSASGVNGFGLNVKTPAFLQADSKMRDFMLGRFLPAARAIASDVPQNSFKKIANKEKPQEVKKSVNKDNDHSKVQHRYGPKFLQDVSHDKDEEHDDYDDSDYEYQELGKKSSKFCGLIPRFRSVNQAHGMRVRARLPISPANRTQPSNSSSSSFRETVSEPARSAEYKHTSTSSVLKSESIELGNIEGSKLYSRLQGPWISVDVSGSLQSTVSEQSDSSSKKKGLRFRELLADKNTNEVTATNSQDSIFEKTLYVDTVRVVESPKENPIPSFTKPQCSFNEPLESDMFADDPKHNMKTRKCKDLDAELELFGDVKGNQKLKAYETRIFQHPAPLPLPKSPSDSWLYRTLPSVSSKKVPMLWIPKYPSAYSVVIDPKTNEDIKLQSPQEQMSPLRES